MRFAVLPGLLLAAACSQGGGSQGSGEGEDRIACMVGGSHEFREDCVVERNRRDGILTLIVRHPDGAFRRFDVLQDGRGLAVADGATQAITRFENGFAELAVGTDRYRFPVTVTGDAAKR